MVISSLEYWKNNSFRYLCKDFIRDMSNWQKNIAKYLLPLLFIGYYGSISFFYHTHHIENGFIIVHSHPYIPGANGSDVGHSHSDAEYTIIQHLSSFVTTGIFPFLMLVLAFILLRELHKRITSPTHLIFCHQGANGHRAPPALLSFFR